MMPRIFRSVNIDDVAIEYTQVIQINDNNTDVCYELLKHDVTNKIVVHYNSDGCYVIKEFINANVTLEEALEGIGLSVDNFHLVPEYSNINLETTLKTKVADLPLLQGYSVSSRFR